MWSDWKKQIERRPKVRHSLLWEYDLCGFDWQYMRALVVERVIERGWDEDYYALFALYGGIEGVRQIIRDEVLLLSDKDMAFVCTAFNLNKEELKCYNRKREDISARLSDMIKEENRIFQPLDEADKKKQIRIPKKKDRRI